MISTHVHSPHAPKVAAPSAPRVSPSPEAALPADTAAIGSRPSLGRKAGVALMAGAALLGAGLLTPGTASARPFHYGYGMSMPYHHHHGSNLGSAVAGFAAGAILGTVISGIANHGAPTVVYQAPPVVTPGFSDGGYNGVGCDGQAHHFDGYGNVADGTGHYRLGVTPDGACVAGPAGY